MAGGTWSTTDKPALPGLYLNFQAAASATVQPGARGVVLAPVKAHWGQTGTFIELNSETGFVRTFTEDVNDGATAYTTLRLALLGGAKKILAYRIASTDAASARMVLQDTSVEPINALHITAKYAGSRGNQFTITVSVNPIDNAAKDIKLYEKSTLLRTFTFTSGTIAAAVDAINNDKSNIWINASKLSDGNGKLANVSGVAFTGGDSGIDNISNSDYLNFLAVAEAQEFNVITLDGVSDTPLQTTVVSWVKRLREEGKNVQAVLGASSVSDTAVDAVSQAIARSAGFNHEGVINVGTGLVLDGISYSSSQAAAYAAGLVAGTSLNASTTYAPAPFADVTRRWTRSEQEQAVRNGVFLFIHDGRQVKVLQGINSLITLRQNQNKGWRKIRTISIMDAVNNDLLRTAEDNYIGKVNNTVEGRLALVGAMKRYMLSLAQSGVIEDTSYDVVLDPDYYGANPVQVPEPDQVFVKWTAKLTDVMEQLFGTFVVQ